MGRLQQAVTRLCVDSWGTEVAADLSGATDSESTGESWAGQGTRGVSVRVDSVVKAVRPEAWIKETLPQSRDGLGERVGGNFKGE